MTKKLKPQEALEHIRALWKDEAIDIRRHNHDNTLVLCSDGIPFVLELKIDWPEGVTQWPLKEPERKWRDARMPEDWGKQARFRHYDGDWSDGVLVGYIVSDCVWLDHSLCTFDECQVEDIPAQAETLSEKAAEDIFSPVQENTLKPMPIEIEQHPADREPTDEEVEGACLIYDPWLQFVGKHVYAWEETQHRVRKVLKAWQQVWREQKCTTTQK